jgi:hypothetical protein
VTAAIDRLLDGEAIGEAPAEVDHAHGQQRQERRNEAELDEAGSALVAGEGEKPPHPISLTTIWLKEEAPVPSQ